MSSFNDLATFRSDTLITFRSLRNVESPGQRLAVKSAELGHLLLGASSLNARLFERVEYWCRIRALFMEYARTFSVCQSVEVHAKTALIRWTGVRLPRSRRRRKSQGHLSSQSEATAQSQADYGKSGNVLKGYGQFLTFGPRENKIGTCSFRCLQRNRNMDRKGHSSQ